MENQCSFFSSSSHFETLAPVDETNLTMMNCVKINLTLNEMNNRQIFIDKVKALEDLDYLDVLYANNENVVEMGCTIIQQLKEYDQSFLCSSSSSIDEESK
jgi:hypothetical protein